MLARRQGSPGNPGRNGHNGLPGRDSRDGAKDEIACVAGGIVWVRDYSFGGGAVFQKKGVGTRQSRGFAARDGSAVKTRSNILQRLRCQISLDYYTIQPAS